MPRILVFRKRRPGLDRQDYFDDWLGEHQARLAGLPGVTGYVASLAVRAEDGPFDGVDELWFATRAQADRARAGAVAGEAWPQHALCEAVPVAEHPFVDSGRRPRFKLVAALKRRRDLSRAAFAEWWLERHAPLVVEFPHLSRYCVSLVEADEVAATFVDGVAEVCFDDLATLERVMFSPQVREVQGDSEVHTAARHRLVAEEHRIV